MVCCATLSETKSPFAPLSKGVGGICFTLAWESGLYFFMVEAPGLHGRSDFGGVGFSRDGNDVNRWIGVLPIL